MTQGIATEKEVILSMLVETQNNLTKSLIANRLFSRAQIKGSLDIEGKKRMGMNQEMIKQSQEMIANLKEFLKEAKDENPLADVIQ